jgi:anti-sigma-K factor RskA
MTDGDDIEMLAAEYVLGTLDAAERADVARRRAREPQLDAAISAWERRLGPLATAVPAVEPPADLLDKIRGRIDRAGAGGEVVVLRRALRRWRAVGLSAMAAAAALLVVIGVREAGREPPSRYVAVFHQNDETPSFLLSIDLTERRVTIQPVAAPRQPDRTYQLWIASDQLGARPRSLGLLSDASLTTAEIDLPIDVASLRTATFGISVEPKGGSPTGVPTGPALHARLLRVPQTN